MIQLLLLLISIAVPYKSYDVTLVDCYDGDTCTFNFHLGKSVTLDNERVRLCDINTPEIRPLKTRAAGIAARDKLLLILRLAKKITVMVPQKTNCDLGSCDKTGKYGRTLAKVYADDVYVNEKLVIEGYAERYMECK